jgi:hypothetical protein
MKTKQIIRQHQRRIDSLLQYIATVDASEYPNRVQNARGEIASLRASLAMWERIRERRARALIDGDRCSFTDAVELVDVESVAEPGWDD